MEPSKERKHWFADKTAYCIDNNVIAQVDEMLEEKESLTWHIKAGHTLQMLNGTFKDAKTKTKAVKSYLAWVDSTGKPLVKYTEKDFPTTIVQYPVGVIDNFYNTIESAYKFEADDEKVKYVLKMVRAPDVCPAFAESVETLHTWVNEDRVERMVDTMDSHTMLSEFRDQEISPDELKSKLLTSLHSPKDTTIRECNVCSLGCKVYKERTHGNLVDEILPSDAKILSDVYFDPKQRARAFMTSSKQRWRLNVPRIHLLGRGEFVSANEMHLIKPGALFAPTVAFYTVYESTTYEGQHSVAKGLLGGYLITNGSGENNYDMGVDGSHLVPVDADSDDDNNNENENETNDAGDDMVIEGAYSKPTVTADTRTTTHADSVVVNATMFDENSDNEIWDDDAKEPTIETYTPVSTKPSLHTTTAVTTTDTKRPSDTTTGKKVTKRQKKA